MRDFLKVLGWSFLVAGGSAVLVFILAFTVPLMIGGPGAHQAPLAAFLYAPAVFFAVFVIALVVQVRRTLRLNIGGKIAYLVLLALLLIPTARIVTIFGEINPLNWIRNTDFKAYGKSERLKHIPTLTDDERRLLQSAHFNIRIGVVDHSYPDVYTRSLIDDLKKTGLFDEVAEFSQTGKADLIATLKGTYYGDKRGQSFTLQPPDGPGKESSTKIFYTLGGQTGSGEAKQYLDRLSISLVNTVPELLNREQYEGNRSDGAYTGHGTFVWANGQRYEGDFVKGQHTGQGTMTSADGTRYEGEWQNN